MDLFEGRKILLSYSREDIDPVRTRFNKLKGKGLESWPDSSDPSIGRMKSSERSIRQVF